MVRLRRGPAQAMAADSVEHAGSCQLGRNKGLSSESMSAKILLKQDDN